MMILRTLLIFISLILLIESKEAGYYGLDISVHQGNVSQASWNCLKNSTFKDYAIIHAWRSIGSINPYVNDMIKRARAAGFKNIDIYVFLKFSLSPTQQIQQTVDFIKKGGQTFGTLWLDIEGKSYWGTIPENIKYFKEAVQATEKLGIKCAIYTNAWQWSQIMGTNSDFKHLPLWYAHYDDKPNYDDFKPFGGWTKPFMKQYKGTTGICGTSIDKNWRMVP